MISFNLHHHQHLHQHQSHFRSLSTSSSPPTFLHGVWRIESREKWVNNGLRCSSDNAIIRPYAQVYTETITSDPQQIKWHETMNIDHMQQQSHKITRSNAIMKLVNMIKSMLNSMGDGEITVSAYDTAWVALVKNIHGTGSPQFPSSLEWIVKNQLEDGSWGFSELFLAHDRLINTLACVIALKSWNLSPERCEKGMKFIRENMCKLEHDRAEHMLIGFEVAFPSLIELARNINLEILDDSSFLQDIYAKRNLKLKRIPKDMMHSVPTTLLHSLEGMLGLDWEKLLKLQCLDGSFLFSPSSTAFALMQTKDENCLKYLNKVVKRFNGGVPNVYPVDLFEHIWVVDRLDRLGISRYFQSEINQCLDYVYRYYSEDGICWARNSKVHDIDDTAMAFRLLRLHGYDISHNVFHHFEKGGEFFCFAGQSNQALTGIYNLYRASQLSFPDEKILDEAKTFAYKFLREKQASNQLLLDKWIIIKDLPGEVGYALDVPWYASLPRIETRLYIEQYGGEDDVWIGKTLYRMPYVNNNTYLELAKLDYNNCQALHQSEWIGILKWYAENNLKDLGVKMRKLLESYFLAMSNIYEPKRAIERLAWAKTTILMEVVSTYMRKSSIEIRRAFIHAFNSGTNIAYYDDKSLSNKSPTEEAHQQKLMDALVTTLNHLSLDAKVVHGKDICTCLNKSWETWMMIHMNEEDNGVANGGGADLIVRTIAMFRSSNNNCSILEGELSHRDFDRLATLTNRIYQQLGRIRNNKDCEKGWCNGKSNSTITLNVESQMKELLQYVLCSTDGLDREIKHTFLTIAKSSFYAAYCNPSTIRLHIAKVLFRKVA